MKKIISVILSGLIFNGYADTQTHNETDMSGMNHEGMTHKSTNTTQDTMAGHSMGGGGMYVNFGMGLGTGTNLEGGSLGLNAMTMGFYYKPQLGVEVGMDMLTNAKYQGKDSMINVFHLATKGVLPLSDVYSLYGKLGIGVNAGMGGGSTPVSAGIYYGAGMQFHLGKSFSLYIEDSGVYGVSGASTLGRNTNIATVGLEFKM